MRKPKIHLSPPHMCGRELHYIKEAFDTNWVAPVGPNIEAFEKEMARHVGINDAVAVNSGTAALHLALSVLNVGKGDIVFCSTLTFVASANPILYQGAEPVFIDSEPDTWNMSPLALRKALHLASLEGRMPKAVIVVNLYGQSAKMDELLLICNYYGVPIIEDAAESLGSSYKGKASGTLGAFGVYSFNGNKIITTSGGGMLVSNNIASLKTARFLATQARDPEPYYQHHAMGYNYRMSNLLAGVGRIQLQQLEKRVDAKRLIYRNYFDALGDIEGISFMPELDNTKSNRWLTALTIDERQLGVTVGQILTALQQENIEARHVWKPMHLQPLFKGTRYYPHKENTHIAEQLFVRGICLPSGSNLSENDQQRVIQCIKELLERKRKRQLFILGKYEVMGE
ncbi:aminotransferase class I/II-fold pyridoxal phosphate-dependent enzyme [Virgibacillus sp. W0430]|uniref:aminotransferase class I/II-fold pyridoxal phosphate-dependent enzyme n=1 Tax=Virgibacillus sp. W0430 TaxID=3391580 RepID=UPI003F44B3D9